MRKRILLLACVALGGLALALGLLLSRSDDPTPPLIQTAESLYKNKYDSLAEMLAREDAVAVTGRVTSAYATERIGDGMLFTDRLVLVDQVLYGVLADPEAKRIKVRQTGGTVGRETLKIADAKLLLSNEQVLLVLHYDPTFRIYWIKGGGDGYFLIDGSKLRHANYDGANHPLATSAPPSPPTPQTKAGLRLSHSPTPETHYSEPQSFVSGHRTDREVQRSRVAPRR